jgi:hypothetical protein
MRLMAKLLGLTLFGSAVLGAPPAEALLITQEQINLTLCVDVKESSTAPNAIVWAFPCNGTIAEQWNFIGPVLQGLTPATCLQTKGRRLVDGTPVVLNSCPAVPGSGQSWDYHAYQIRLLGTDQCLDSEPGEARQLVIHKCVGASTQLWTLH